jgi:hypothetical protein
LATQYETPAPKKHLIRRAFSNITNQIIFALGAIIVTAISIEGEQLLAFFRGSSGEIQFSPSLTQTDDRTNPNQPEFEYDLAYIRRGSGALEINIVTSAIHRPNQGWDGGYYIKLDIDGRPLCDASYNDIVANDVLSIKKQCAADIKEHSNHQLHLIGRLKDVDRQSVQGTLTYHFRP